MALVAPAKPKAVVTETPRGLVIVMPPKRNLFTTLFLGIWLCGWAWGEITTFQEVLAPHGDSGQHFFLIVWLAGWSLGGIFFLYVFLWSVGGRERILVGPSRLGIRRELFGVGRLREYETRQISNLRVSLGSANPTDLQGSLRFWGIGGGFIAFDYGAATIRLGVALEEGEARALVSRLAERMNLSDAPRT